jgi:hypothetical protein
MKDFAHLLLGKGLRSITKSNEVVESVQDQSSFDALFSLLWHHERPLVMRAADAVEKITRKHREFLLPHKEQLLSLLKSAINKELKWHIAQLVPRLNVDPHELKEVWSVLTYWSQNPNESKIVRVNSLQGLFELTQQYPSLRPDFEHTLHTLEREPIPSIQARIKKLRKALPSSGRQ